MNLRKLFISVLVILLLLIILFTPSNLAPLVFALATCVAAFYLWGVFTDDRRHTVPDKITQGDDPLGQYFNKYEGL